MVLYLHNERVNYLSTLREFRQEFRKVLRQLERGFIRCWIQIRETTDNKLDNLQVAFIATNV